jgi:DNA-binding beta-propeller fold protein YncE
VYVADSENGRVVKLDSSGNFLGKWQISGSTEGERGYPTDIAVNSAGNVFVVEHLGHAIHAFDSDSNFVRKWVIEFVPPSFPLGYAFYGMDMDTQDNIVLADPRNDRVEKFDPSGNSLARWGLYGSAEGEFRSLSAIAIDAFGNVFVADGRNYRVQKFDSFGKFLLKWGSKGSGDGQFGGNYAGPSDVMIDSSGNVIVADYANGRIQKFDSLGNFLQKWETRDPDEGKLLYPSAIALDSLGNVFILAAECVHKFDSSGDFVCKWGSHGSGNGQFDSPSGIEVDPSGNVYVVDARNYRIQKFDSAGNLLCKWGSFGTGDGQFWEASGIALDPFGNAFVSEANNHRIQKFDSSGRFLTKWGHEGFGEGEFFRPSDAAVDSSGNVLVADAGNYRIQMFRRDFGMRGIVGPPELPVIEWDCAPNKGYRVWASVDLSEWTALGSAIFGSNTGINSWTDDGQHPLGPASEALRRFYRVELQQ